MMKKAMGPTAAEPEAPPKSPPVKREYPCLCTCAGDMGRTSLTQQCHARSSKSADLLYYLLCAGTDPWASVFNPVRLFVCLLRCMDILCAWGLMVAHTCTCRAPLFRVR